MDLLSEFLEKETERLKTCWVAFLSPFRELKLPLPPRYAEEFERVKALPREEKDTVFLKILRETRQVLNWLLSQEEIRGMLATKGRLADLEEIVNRLAELENQVDYLREELLRDDLTKLWNRRALSIFFPEIIKRITEGKELYILAFLDLCDFKEVNDFYGHQVGDKVLVKTAKRLRDFTKGVDVPIRLGGDEFILLLATHSLDKAEPFLLELTSVPIEIEGLEKYLACGATDILGSDSLESCLHRADLAMYKHKSQIKAWLKEGRQGSFPPPVLFRAYCKDI